MGEQERPGLALGCAACPKRARCRTLCAGARAFVAQDEQTYRREALVTEVTGGRTASIEVLVDHALGGVWSTSGGGFRIAGREARPADVRALVDRLTDTERRRAWAHFADGRSARDIAREEGVSHVAVAKSLRRVTRKLRRAIGDRPSGSEGAAEKTPRAEVPGIADESRVRSERGANHGLPKPPPSVHR